MSHPSPIEAPSPIENARDRRAFRLFMLLAFVLLGAGIGLRDPWPSDEPRFTLSAKQMVESGDWLFPHRGRELYSDKPPMLMWTEAAAYEVTRSWRVAFLLPSLLAGLLTLGLTYDLGRRFWNHKAGLCAGDRSAVRVPVHVPGQARADRSADHGLDHARELGAAAALPARAELARVLARLLRRRSSA